MGERTMENRKAEGLAGWREAADASPVHEFYPTPLHAVSQCRGCRFFDPVGRRGGECLRLGVPVAGVWTACALAEPVFALRRAEPTPPWALSPELGATASVGKNKNGENLEGVGVRTTERSRVD